MSNTIKEQDAVLLTALESMKQDHNLIDLQTSIAEMNKRMWSEEWNECQDELQSCQIDNHLLKSKRTK